ncbi:MAG: GHMP kinase [Bacteroidia bacterium]|nr:GHMP kinase [Bacteroidia bacterium]
MGSNSFHEASAQGRLDVMGGIADYSGSLVMQMPISEKTSVRLKLRQDFVCTFESITESGERLLATIDYRKFLKDEKVDYAFAHEELKRNAGNEWIGYVIGCALVLQKERQIDFKGGDFFIESNVPLGKGVSSSASLEVATMKAVANAFNITFTGTELPLLAQRTENFIVGAPCGLMDQLTSYFGEPRKFLSIVCQPDRVEKAIPIPDHIFFLGIDSGIRHSVGGASYADVRCATFMGYTIIAQALGASRNDIRKAIEHKDFSDLPGKGYLCNVALKEFKTNLSMLLPDRMLGEEFLLTYGNSIDTATTIDSTKQYDIKTCAAHPIYENERVHHFRQLLIDINQSGKMSHEGLLVKMGELMYEAHESYTCCGLGSDRTDDIVRLARGLGSSVYGAKITGGGSGGTVCILAEGEEGRKSVHNLHQELCNKYSSRLRLFQS